MFKRFWAVGIAALTISFLCAVGFVGCSGGGGGGGPHNVNRNSANDNDGGEDTSAGAAAFAANGCSTCHTPQNNNFSDSSIDDIVDTLLGDKAHPGGDFGELTDQEIEDITDFLIAVMLGEDDLDDGEDNENDNADGGGTQAHAWFEQVWTDFDRNYSHFEDKGVDWNAIRDEYEPQFQGDLSTDQFVTKLAEMLAELRDLHVWLFDVNDQPVEVYSRPAAENYPSGYPERYYPGGVQQLQGYPLWHGWMDHNLAYISIESFEGDRWDGLGTGELDTLFATYAEADALVVDVRPNNGGNEIVATAIVGHLTDQSYVYGYHRTKNPGPDHADFGAFEEHRLEAAENQRFLKPVACLIGERNMSSAEWFVLMMLENPRGITLIGDATRGSSGNPQEFSLDNGIKYYIPSWEAYRADQTTKIEDVGVPPTTGYAIAPEESLSGDQDFVLERAVELLAP